MQLENEWQENTIERIGLCIMYFYQEEVENACGRFQMMQDQNNI